MYIMHMPSSPAVSELDLGLGGGGLLGRSLRTEPGRTRAVSLLLLLLVLLLSLVLALL